MHTNNNVRNPHLLNADGSYKTHIVYDAARQASETSFLVGCATGRVLERAEVEQAPVAVKAAKAAIIHSGSRWARQASESSFVVGCATGRSMERAEMEREMTEVKVTVYAEGFEAAAAIAQASNLDLYARKPVNPHSGEKLRKPRNTNQS